MMPKNAYRPESADFIDQLFIDIVTNGIHVRVQWITPVHVLSAKCYAGT